ncbi:MAG: hypothetical protein SGILL_001210 [Bacillariaceae sp.]
MGLCVAWQVEEEYASKVLQLMTHQGLQPEHSTYRTSLKLCHDYSNAAAAEGVVLGDTEIESLNDMEPRPTDIGLVVSTLCKSKVASSLNRRPTTEWRKGLKLLQSAATVPASSIASDDSEDSTNSSTQNIIPTKAYNDVLLCMKKDRQWKDAVRLLRWMEKGGGNNRGTRKGDTIENDDNSKPIVQNYGFIIPSPSLSTYQMAVECCLDSNQVDSAFQIIHDMQRRNIQPKTGTFQIILSSLQQKRQWKKALNLLDTMIEMDVPRTVTTYNTVIGACAKAREVGMARHLLQRMKKDDDSVRPDVISYNSVIGACANTARWKEALEVLDQCYREPGVTPTIYTYTNAMRACARGGKSQRALSLLEVVKDKGLPLDSYCYTAVIDACAKGGKWRKAQELFNEMEERGIEASGVTYSVTISALGNGLQWEKALWMLNVMRDKKMTVNLITYNAAITALAKSARETAKRSVRQNGSVGKEAEELWPKALGLLDQMKEDGIEPDGFCYSSAINCCGAEGRWKEACELIDIMRKGGPNTRPNKIAYTAAIGACGKAGRAGKALELFATMKSEGLKADRIAFNALFSAVRTAKNADKAFELWNEMCSGSVVGRRPTPVHKRGPRRGGFDTSPDIITVSDCVATLSRAGHLDQMDKVFEEAVKRGIVLHGNALDGQWEVDMSRLQLPVGRAACRYLLNGLKKKDMNDTDVQDMVFITGVGRAHEVFRESPASVSASNILDKKDPTTSLRDFIQAILESDFQPGLKSIIPQRAKGTVVIEKDALIDWLRTQED